MYVVSPYVFHVYFKELVNSNYTKTLNIRKCYLIKVYKVKDTWYSTLRVGMPEIMMNKVWIFNARIYFNITYFLYSYFYYLIKWRFLTLVQSFLPLFKLCISHSILCFPSLWLSLYVSSFVNFIFFKLICLAFLQSK